ncbi:hypothetical protein ANN_03201 [Periplaneta americana]|uniref:Uncharacterized protein n=1 Tax=Periplaneta americana TaxID=6978 RepID=A0ABQ8U2B1_PERAM|nr:hypothetical protein ANN_03201 [Periplaneta americana]
MHNPENLSYNWAVAATQDNVNDFYDILEKVPDNSGLKDKPNHIWNLEETGFYMVPKPNKRISSKGSRSTTSVVYQTSAASLANYALTSTKSSASRFLSNAVHCTTTKRKRWRPGLPIPTPPDDITLTEVIQSVPDVQTELQNDPDFVEDDAINEPHFLTQEDLNDLVRYLGLSKSKGELLASRLKGWKLLQIKPK